MLADVVLGAHGELTEWVFDVVTTLAGASSSRPVLRVDRFDEIEFLAEPQPILLTHYPSKQLIDAISRNDVGVLFVVEPPGNVLRFMQTVLKLQAVEAIRLQTASAVANYAVGNSTFALILSRDTERTAGDVVRRIAEHLRLRCTAAEVGSVLERACGFDCRDETLEEALERRWARVLPDSPRTIGPSTDPLAAACGEIMVPLLAMARGDTTRPVVWPTPVFTFAGSPEHRAPSVAEIAGPVRNLYYGPYLYLPPARYRVEAILIFSDEIRDVPFVLEVHGGNWLAKARIEERRAGNYRGYFMLDHREPTSTVEIRLRNENAVARGRLSLIELLYFISAQP